MEGKKVFGIVLGVIALVVVAVGGTYAWYRWSSSVDDNTGVEFSVASDANCVVTTPTQTGQPNLIPTLTKEEGYITTLAITENCSSNSVLGTFTLTLTTFPENLRGQATFKYDFVKVVEGNETSVAAGNFSANSEGDVITFSTSETILDSATYRLYLWIDGSTTNPSTMQNQTYNFDLVANYVGQ